MHIGPLWSPGLQLLSWSLHLFVAAAPWILGIGLAAAVGRTIQVGLGRTWPKPAYVAFEVAVEAVRLLIVLVAIGLGEPLAGARRIGDFISGVGRDEAFARLGAGWGQHWPQALAACVLFTIAGAVANAVVFAIAGLAPVRRIAASAGVAEPDDKRAKLAAVLFIKNLTIIPFSVIWLWGLVLYLAR